jgi:hypothetical protein
VDSIFLLCSSGVGTMVKDLLSKQT